MPEEEEPCLTLVVAWDAERGIGRGGDLPWHHSEDLRHFRRVTLGHAVLMGRICYESIGRPLPKRRNLVLTRSPDFAPPGVEVFSDFDEMVRAARETDHAPCVIGGAQVYALAMPRVVRMVITEVPGTHEADVFFPPFDEEDFEAVGTETLGEDGLRVRTLVRR